MSTKKETKIVTIPIRCNWYGQKKVIVSYDAAQEMGACYGCNYCNLFTVSDMANHSRRFALFCTSPKRPNGTTELDIFPMYECRWKDGQTAQELPPAQPSQGMPWRAMTPSYSTLADEMESMPITMTQSSTSTTRTTRSVMRGELVPDPDAQNDAERENRLDHIPDYDPRDYDPGDE